MWPEPALEAMEAGRWCRGYLGALRLSPEGLAIEPGSSWQDDFLSVFRHYREISENPNYNLLTERYDFNVHLPAEEREKSVEFHKSLRSLEEASTFADGFAHHSLLYYLRNAQKIAWPLQEGGNKALEHRQRLEGLSLSESLNRLRAFYLLLREG